MVCGPNTKAIIYEHTYYQGRSYEVRGQVPFAWFAQNNFNDLMSSIKIMRE